MAVFTNQATLSYNNTTTSSNIVTGEIVEVLSGTKTALDDSYQVGDTITYIISIINSGTTAFTGLSINDNLGAYTVDETTAITVTPLTYVAGSARYYLNGVLQANPTTVAGPPLLISGISVPAGGNALIIYEVTANGFAPLVTGSTITNTATISGTGLSTPLTLTETITAASEAQLSITKSVSPTTVAENGELTYTFIIQNTGNTAAIATDNVVVTDNFNPILENITVTLNDTVLTEGTQYTYNETTGTFQTVPSVITVPAATYTQDPDTGEWNIVPGVTVLEITGTL